MQIPTPTPCPAASLRARQIREAAHLHLAALTCPGRERKEIGIARPREHPRTDTAQVHGAYSNLERIEQSEANVARTRCVLDTAREKLLPHVDLEREHRTPHLRLSGHIDVYVHPVDASD